MFLNRYSLLFAVGLPVLFILFLLLRGEGSRVRQLASVALLVAAVTLFLLLRPGISDATMTGEAAEQHLATAGQPVLVEVYSDY